jgi:hypothetical protein
MWIAIAGLGFSVLSSVILVSMYIQNLKSGIKANEVAVQNVCKAHEKDIHVLEQAMMVRNEFNEGIFKELKDELKDIKTLMMEIVKQLPKRGDEK